MKKQIQIFTENDRGITIIALIITIIILLILAGISIGQLTKSGLFEKAKLAKETTEQAEKDEKQVLKSYENNIDKYTTGIKTINANNYSTDELEVGTWIDGKSIYQKTIDCGTLPNNTEKRIPSEIQNIDHLVSIGGIAIKSSGLETLPLPYPHCMTTSVVILDFRENDIYISTKANFSAYNAYVTIQYTKK